MTLLICYKNYYGAHVFFLPGAHSMLKTALYMPIYSNSKTYRCIVFNMITYVVRRANRYNYIGYI